MTPKWCRHCKSIVCKTLDLAEEVDGKAGKDRNKLYVEAFRDCSERQLEQVRTQLLKVQRYAEFLVRN